MDLQNWEKGPEGKVLKSDVTVAKNYLTKPELESLGRIVNAYLELAEERAQRRIPMTMEDWAKRLDAFLQFDERDILEDAGSITSKAAKEHTESEFEKLRPREDLAYQSDFDKEVKTLQLPSKNKKKAWPPHPVLRREVCLPTHALTKAQPSTSEDFGDVPGGRRPLRRVCVRRVARTVPPGAPR